MKLLERIKLYGEVVMVCGAVMGGALALFSKFYLLPLIKEELVYVIYCQEELLTRKQTIDALDRWELYKKTGQYVPPKKGEDDAEDRRGTD